MSTEGGGLDGIYLLTPAKGLAEGEIETDPNDSRRRLELANFAHRLLGAVMPDGEWQLSSFSIDWSGLEPAGRIYGQSWLERPGTSVSFLRFWFCDRAGRLVATGAATAHNAAVG